MGCGVPRLPGHAGADAAYTCRPQYEVARAGQSGGTGFADLALGRFGQDADGIPQVLCEFKDIRSILAHNIYGVDINPESVEITKLALWLHTAAPGKPLCALDRNICCGNSLVGTDIADFYREKHTTLFEQADENERERINAFDWQAAFPDVFSHGGFDCVIGNPPYIKLQHFRRTQPDIAAYLVEQASSLPPSSRSVAQASNLPSGASPKPQASSLPTRKQDACATLYTSTQSGNFDMYLSFIEKGLRLLRPEGRMGYIAPNVWMVNEYGKALRQHIRANRALDRWLDFKSHQIFDEAITYTALQFFRGSPSDTLTCAFAPDGAIATVDWLTADQIPYNQLPEEDAWTLAPKAERQLIDRLSKTCKPLQDCCKAIVVGIQTSADDIYHLKRISTNRYETRSGLEVAIEDALMHPIVSGSDVKRYQTPHTDTHLLFPYCIESSQKARLFTAQEMQTRFPLGWAYLETQEAILRGREKGKMDVDTKWWGYVYPKNLDKGQRGQALGDRAEGTGSW